MQEQTKNPASESAAPAASAIAPPLDGDGQPFDITRQTYWFIDKSGQARYMNPQGVNARAGAHTQYAVGPGEGNRTHTVPANRLHLTRAAAEAAAPGGAL